MVLLLEDNKFVCKTMPQCDTMHEMLNNEKLVCVCRDGYGIDKNN